MTISRCRQWWLNILYFLDWPTKEWADIELNDAQERVIKEWAANDRLWTTQETVEVNLRTFACLILKALP